MSPLPKHEEWKSRIGRMIELMSLELGIHVRTLGSTTFRRKRKKVGLEPDECYYVQHIDAVRGKDRLDLEIDPPPDLVVEIDITRRSIAREPIYAALRVPELWRYDAKRLAVLELNKEGKYSERPSSLAFPFLPMEPFAKYLDRMRAEDDLTVLRDFHQWVRTLTH
jgi:Uma2 family endonuclease